MRRFAAKVMPLSIVFLMSCVQLPDVPLSSARARVEVNPYLSKSCWIFLRNKVHERPARLDFYHITRDVIKADFSTYRELELPKSLEFYADNEMLFEVVSSFEYGFVARLKISPQQRRRIVLAFSGPQPASTLEIRASDFRFFFEYPPELTDFFKTPGAFCTAYLHRAESLGEK